MVTWVTALGARRSVRRATPVDDQASAFDAGAVAGAARVAEPQLVGRWSGMQFLISTRTYPPGLFMVQWQKLHPRSSSPSRQATACWTSRSRKVLCIVSACSVRSSGRDDNHGRGLLSCKAGSPALDRARESSSVYWKPKGAAAERAGLRPWTGLYMKLYTRWFSIRAPSQP